MSRSVRLPRAILSVALCASAIFASPASAGKLSLRQLQNSSEFALKKTFVPPSGREAKTDYRLSFKMQTQTHDNWCWAATSSSVSKYFNKKSVWSQCRVAGAEVGADCCNDFSEETCDKTWRLQKALLRTDNYDESPACVSPDHPCGVESFDAVAQQIDRGRPVGVRIGWHGGGGHFIAILGYSRSAAGNAYFVDDPISGPSLAIGEEDLKTNYRFAGSWTHTYFTKAAKTAAPRIAQTFNAPAPKLSLPGRARVAGTVEKIGFKLSPVDDSISAAIESTREPKSVPSKAKSSLAVPHDVYVGELDKLAAEKPALPDKPVGVRVLEMSNGEVSAAFDLRKSDGKPAAVVNGPMSAQFTGNVTSALRRALKLSERTTETPELRLLQVPALNFEALWVHYQNEADDMFVPTLMSGKATMKPMTRTELLDVLQTRAQRRLKDQQTDSAP